MWVEEEGLVFVQCRDANRAPIEPCAEVAAHRPRFVWAARNASGEDSTLHSTACRHQDSQESSGDDKMAPYRVRARAPPHRAPPRTTPLDRSETYTPPTRPTHPSSTWRTSHVPWPGSSVRGPPQKRRPRVPRPPHRRPLSSPPRRMARPTDLRVRRPQTVLATSLGHSGPSAAMSPRTSSAASPKFTRWQQAAFTASQRSHIETLLQGHNRSHDHELLHQRHVPRAKASPLRRPWPETSTHQGRHGDATVEAAR